MTGWLGSILRLVIRGQILSMARASHSLCVTQRGKHRIDIQWLLLFTEKGASLYIRSRLVRTSPEGTVGLSALFAGDSTAKTNNKTANKFQERLSHA